MDGITEIDRNTKICRICLETQYELRSIYKMGKILDHNVKLCDVLADCTSLVMHSSIWTFGRSEARVKIGPCTLCAARKSRIFNYHESQASAEFDPNDNLPGFLCNNCLLRASKMFMFRQLAFESNIVLRQKLKNNERLSVPKESPIPKPEDSIVEGDMEYVTVFVSSDNQIGTENDQMQLFEPVEMDDYNEAIHEGVEFEEEIAELEVTEDECNSDIDPSIVTDEHEIDKQNTSMTKGTDYSADESMTTSSQDGPRKQRFRRKQNQQAKSFKCDICGKVLSNQSSHKYHMQLHSAATPFLCSECGKGFKTRNAYDGHMVTHLPSNPNTCEICGNSYRQAASLRSHMLVHTGEKPFVCGICGKGMTQKSGFKKHMLTHTGEKPHTCDICSKDFRYSSNLINHRRAHLGERNYTCETCEKSFVGSEQLKRHKLTHTGERPFQCSICSRSFNRKSTLQIHTKTHSDGRKNSCKICGKVYVKVQYLEAHMKMVHSQ